MNPIPKTTSPAEHRDWIASGTDVVALDVRSAAKFETLHVTGSCNVFVPLLVEHTEVLAAKLEPKVVLVCQSGVRATEDTMKLAGVGLENAHVPTDGVFAYQQAGDAFVLLPRDHSAL